MPQLGQAAKARIENLRKKQRKDEPRTEVPDKVLAVSQRREQQGIGRKRLPQLKPAESAQKCRTHAVNGIPQIQRNEQLFCPVRQIGRHTAIKPEEIARTEGEHHQMKGIIPK